MGVLAELVLPFVTCFVVVILLGTYRQQLTSHAREKLAGSYREATASGPKGVVRAASPGRVRKAATQTAVSDDSDRLARRKDWKQVPRDAFSYDYTPSSKCPFYHDMVDCSPTKTNKQRKDFRNVLCLGAIAVVTLRTATTHYNDRIHLRT